MSQPTIAVLAFDGISPFHLAVPCAVFGEDRSADGLPRFRFRVCAMERGPLRTTAGFTLAAPHRLRDLERASTVIVPTWRDPEERPPEPLLNALRRADARGARLVGLCLGTFVLAAAGVLDGRRATTHWRWADRLAQLYPAVRVDPGVLYVDEGRVLTSAGTAAGLDCCLHLLRRDHGAEVAAAVARRLVVPPHRQGGQAQYIEQPLPAVAERHPLSEVLAWATRNLHRPLGLDELARRAHMSRRTFTRRFRAAEGTTPAQWVTHQRLALAQRLLETSDRPIEWVAQRAGFGTALSMRKNFIAAFRVSPRQYRQEFRGR